MTTESAYEIDFFRPADAAGVVELYRTIYGDNYPVRSVYDAREIVRQDKNHETYRMVARTPKGEVIGHVAVYRSVPPIPNQNLFECGQLIVRPDYRQTPISFELLHACVSEIPVKFQLEIWGEAVCNHLFTQQMSVREGMVETALEMDLMPESAYSLPSSQTAGGRVSVLSIFLLSRTHRQKVYMPAAYTDFLTFIYKGIKKGRTLMVSVADLPSGTTTDGSMEVFADAGVARVTVNCAGSDFSGWIAQHEKKAARANVVVTQIFLPLSLPWTGAAVDVLQKQGYFLGGALPHWFGGDGFLMQKHAGTPNFAGAHMYTKRAKTIKEFVENDWKKGRGRD